MITYQHDIGRPLTSDELDANLSTLFPRMLPLTNQTISGKKHFVSGEIDNVGNPVGLQAIRSKDMDTFLPNGINIHNNETGLSLIFSTSPLRTSNITDDLDVITSEYAHNNLAKGLTISTELPINPDINPASDTWLVTTASSPRTITNIYYYTNGSWNI